MHISFDKQYHTGANYQCIDTDSQLLFCHLKFLVRGLSLIFFLRFNVSVSAFLFFFLSSLHKVYLKMIMDLFIIIILIILKIEWIYYHFFIIMLFFLHLHEIVEGLYFHCSLSVCVCVRNSCEQNSGRTDAPIWTQFSLNGCLQHWLRPYWNWWSWVKGQGHGDQKCM